MPLTIQTSLNLLDAQLCAPKIAQVQQQQTKREREVKSKPIRQHSTAPLWRRRKAYPQQQQHSCAQLCAYKSRPVYKIASCKDTCKKAGFWPFWSCNNDQQSLLNFSLNRHFFECESLCLSSRIPPVIRLHWIIVKYQLLYLCHFAYSS